MTEYLLGIGSNAPGAPQLMERAEEWLHAHFTAVRTSGTYTSAALNGHSPDYLNMVARVSTELSPAEVASLGKKFETECGRTPESKIRGSVEMDIDLVQAGNVIIRPVEFTRGYFLRGLDLLDKR